MDADGEAEIGEWPRETEVVAVRGVLGMMMERGRLKWCVVMCTTAVKI